jgi:GT2 family glycosyltransferase
LASLSTQTFPPNEFEVIVSIDGSEDGTKEMIANFKSSYKLRAVWGQNSGRATACNKGIHEADGEVLIIIDDDMEPTPRFVEAHYSSHLSANKLGVIGAAPILINEYSKPTTLYMADEFNSRLDKKMSDPNYRFEIWDFYSGNFSIHRKDLIEAGGFNESFKTYGYEDIELVQRLIGSGVKIIYNSDAVCIQHHEDDFKSLAMKTISAGKTAVLLVNMHPEIISELKFREYYFTGWKWRSLRLILIWSSILIPITIDAVIYLIKHFEKSDPKTLKYLYSLALDYFFWLGVWSAIKSDKKNEHLISKIRAFKKYRVSADKVNI